MSKKILIIVSNAHVIGPHKRRTGVFLPEVAHPYAEFEEANYQIDFASLTGDTPYLDALQLADDPKNLSFLVGKGWARMQKAAKLSEVDASAYDASLFRAVWHRWLTYPRIRCLSKSSGKRMSAMLSSGPYVMAPVSLLNVRLSNGTYLLEGKNISSFTNEEEENYAKEDVPFELETALTKQGAIFHGAKPWSAYSIEDGNLVTGQNPASAQGVAQKMIKLLEA
jgi:putative intracellular protease/amidase